MSKRIGALLLLLTLLAASCAPQQGGSSFGASSVPEKYWQGSQVAPVPMGEHLFDFTIKLAGQVTSLPGSPVQLLQNGWQGESLQKVVLQPGEQLETELFQQNSSIVALIANTGTTPLQAYKCQLVGLVLEQGDWELPQGIKPGVSQQEIEKLWGTPKQGEPQGLLLYTLGKQSRFEFWIKGQQLEKVRIENHTQWLPQRVPQGELPPQVKNYAAPTELGESWAKGTVEYGGKLYQLPAPVDAFLEDGWLLLPGGQQQVEAEGWLMGVLLVKGNQILRTCVWNYSDQPQPVAACFVTTLYSGKDGPTTPLQLPAGLSLQSEWAQVLAAYGEPNITSETIQGRYYTFGTATQGVQFALAKEEDRIQGISLRFDVLPQG